jgi:hypothetical protein
MLNKEVSSRFQDWLLNPNERLDFEVKGWLDLADKEAIGTVVKALIALENHGGGFLLIGYAEENKRLVPDPNRPTSLEQYNTDVINGLLRRRVEPVFHVEVSLQEHPKTGLEYPLVRVAGNSTVPVRSCSETPQGSLLNNTYYIRAPGPASRAPKDGAEWDRLIKRAVLNQREEIVRVLRAVMPSVALVQDGSASINIDSLADFAKKANDYWQTQNAALDDDNPAKITKGYYSFAARIMGTSRALTLSDIRQLNMSARRYTGWPMFVEGHGKSKSKLVDSCIQGWMASDEIVDVSTADFWRICEDGCFYTLRGYEEDARLPNPGTQFDSLIPIWRLGEFLLRVGELADGMYEAGFEIEIQCEWTGLNGRTLVNAFGGDYRRSYRKHCSEMVVRTVGRFPGTISEILPEVVTKLTTRLYESFEFAEISEKTIASQLTEMSSKQF